MSSTTISNSGTVTPSSSYGLSPAGIHRINNSGAISGLGGLDQSNGGTVSHIQDALIAATSAIGIDVLISGAAGTIYNAASISTAGMAVVGVELTAAGADVGHTSGGKSWGGLDSMAIEGPGDGHLAFSWHQVAESAGFAPTAELIDAAERQ